MIAWLDALNEAWDDLAQLEPVSRQYRTKLISTDVPLDILAGMRAADNAPCLMLQTTPPTRALFELGGMRLSAVPDESGTFLTLSLEDSSRRDLFSTICADVVAAAAVAGREDALSHFLARLDAWRQFLRDRRDGLSQSETVGLIGELLILERLLACNSQLLGCWQAPIDGLHDFRNGGHALEVKTGLGPSSTIGISALDQLDGTGLRHLDLVHVRLTEARDGRTLQHIISAINGILGDGASRRTFENALLRRGLMPDDDSARINPRIELRAMDAYSVTEAFPRLIRSNLPVAISEAAYTLEVRGITSFASDLANTLDAFIRGDQT